ncbi:MAG: hypothetical protein K1W30_04825 [Lachnospiraceae bacterium]
MEKEKLLRILENGKQIGISRIIEVDGEQIVYTCAMQKKQGRYVMYTDEYNLNTFYAHGHPEEICQHTLTGARRASR